MKDNETQGKSQQNLTKVLDLMEIMATARAPMTITEISKALNITRTTAYSIIKSLMAKNFVENIDGSGKYSIGYKFYQIGSLYPMKYMFVKSAERHVEHMSKKWNIKINVSILRPPLVAVVLLTMDRSLIPKMLFGHVMPSHATGVGKLLLSYLPVEEVIGGMSEVEMKKYGPRTITDVGSLLKELEIIRERGYSIELEELAARHACVAAPIRDLSGDVIAGVSFSADLEQFESNREGLIADIILLGQTISAELGYSPLLG